MRNKSTVIFLLVVFGLICLFNLYMTWDNFSIEGSLKGLNSEQIAKKMENKDFYNRYMRARRNSFSLGLDLQGGMFITMEVGVEDLIRLGATKKDEAFEKAMKAARETKNAGSDKSLVNLFYESYKSTTGGKGKPLSYYYFNKDKNIFNQTSDETIIEKMNAEAKAAAFRTFTILRTRVDQFGVVSPNIQMDETNGRILLELPGVKEADYDRVKKLLMNSAKLEFWVTWKANEIWASFERLNTVMKRMEGLDTTSTAIDTTKAPSDSLAKAIAFAKIDSMETDSVKRDSMKSAYLATMDTTKDDTTGMTQAEKEAKEKKERPFFAMLRKDESLRIRGDMACVGYFNISDTAKVNRVLKAAKEGSDIPVELKFLWDAKPPKDGETCVGLIAIKSQNNTAALTGDVITDARQGFEQLKPMIEMEMNSRGAREWAKITGANVNNCIAIVMDDLVYSYPEVKGTITGGRSQITGNFTIEEAQLLANLLKAGSLPIRAEILGHVEIGPTLGAENLGKGMLSFVIAVIITLGFLVFYYTGAGMIANVAMVLNLFFLLGVSASFNVVMTLPGIAAIVLTMGMAVDANVLIFERIREEQALGKSLKAAIQAGFKNAFSSVMDSNITTFLTGVILYAFGIGPIRGFAVTLMIGIITSLICGLLITRILLEYYANRGNESLKFGSGFTTKFMANVDLKMTKRKKKFYAISAVAMVLCLISFFSLGFKTGVDFKGGYLYQVEFNQKVNVESLRGPLTDAFDHNSPLIKTVGGKNQIMVTTSYKKEDPNASSEVQALLMATVNKVYPNHNPKIVNSTAVGPNVAEDIKWSALWSVVFSLIVIFAYILIRFRKWQLSTGAIICLFHDSILVLGVFSLLGAFESLPFSAEIDQTFIAALLTIIGYSINDTVVVYDRIRENMIEMKTSDLPTIYDTSLNQTFRRTLVTSFTTIVTTLVLFFVGGEYTKGFMLAMFIGIVTGTYSSIFVASPIALDLTQRQKAAESPTSK